MNMSSSSIPGSRNVWTSHFEELGRFLVELERQYGYSNHAYAEFALSRLELSIQASVTLQETIRDRSRNGLGELEETVQTLSELVESLRRIRSKWVEYQDILDSGVMLTESAYRAPIVYSGRQGRPFFSVSKEQLEYLSSLNFTWSEIAALLGISRSTLYRRRVEYGIVVDPDRMIGDEDLLSFIQLERERNPSIGESLVSGSLRARGYVVSRDRVREALKASDPLGTAARIPARPSHRRPYSVAGPLSLWHIDSHHKLIRWKMVTHGGIDGYSRLIVFLRCSTNNRSLTVYSLFIEAIQKFHLPSRVRTDQGRENVLVARHMIEHRGAERRSIITGSSVHNQRIERLWRDLHQGVTLLYYRLFYYLEEFGVLDPLNERHLYALHYVFVPRINRSIDEFRHSWNHHRMRTAHHKSPFQLFTAGCMLLQQSQLTAFDFFSDVTDLYGIDPDGPEPIDNDGTVVVPSLNYQLEPEDYQQLTVTINPLSPSSNFGIDLYEEVVEFIDSLASN